jgi:hypothetical protein
MKKSNFNKSHQESEKIINKSYQVLKVTKSIMKLSKEKSKIWKSIWLSLNINKPYLSKKLLDIKTKITNLILILTLQSKILTFWIHKLIMPRMILSYCKMILLQSLLWVINTKVNHSIIKEPLKMNKWKIMTFLKISVKPKMF